MEISGIFRTSGQPAHSRMGETIEGQASPDGAGLEGWDSSQPMREVIRVSSRRGEISTGLLAQPALLPVKEPGIRFLEGHVTGAPPRRGCCGNKHDRLHRSRPRASHQNAAQATAEQKIAWRFPSFFIRAESPTMGVENWGLWARFEQWGISISPNGDFRLSCFFIPGWHDGRKLSGQQDEEET